MSKVIKPVIDVEYGIRNSLHLSINPFLTMASKGNVGLK